ncbi:CRISPR-associated protein [Marinobacterium iners]|uniref:CRISPR-associated ring nuclease Csm6 n=1 Tax=Marinobacterium iners TaxID=48076 RepID=UPI001A8F5D51|nr:CRISPR-associated ring nuclease Csm6 [Marinobacterium iners]QSR34187.1 CRISPR-associated protein [Marinobacterium iners]
MKTMLLAVSGMSPAIITETLYGINKRGDAWPKSIKIITTSIGAEKIWQGLVEHQQLEHLCVELDKPLIQITREDILVVPNAAGEPVVDARSEEDHEALANFIMSTVRDLTQDDHTSIHASLAGGRKTMTFYLGYAMTLFGRHFDRLSHVLVSEGFEGHPDFYFPTRSSREITNRDGEKLDTKNAVVTLADIPFIRQRQLVPEMLTEFGERVNFRKLVDQINLGEDVKHLKLQVNAKAQTVRISSPAYPSIDVEVGFSGIWSWTLYLLILEESLLQPEQGRGGFTRPSKPDDILPIMMATKLAALKDIQLRSETANEMLNELLQHDQLLDAHPNLERTFKPIIEKGGVTGSQFDSYLQQLQKSLQHALPKNLANALLPTQIYGEDGELLNNTGKSKHKGAGYGIALPEPLQQIDIV